MEEETWDETIRVPSGQQSDIAGKQADMPLVHTHENVRAEMRRQRSEINRQKSAARRANFAQGPSISPPRRKSGPRHATPPVSEASRVRGTSVDGSSVSPLRAHVHSKWLDTIPPLLIGVEVLGRTGSTSNQRCKGFDSPCRSNSFGSSCGDRDQISSSFSPSQSPFRSCQMSPVEQKERDRTRQSSSSKNATFCPTSKSQSHNSSGSLCNMSFESAAIASHAASTPRASAERCPARPSPSWDFDALSLDMFPHTEKNMMSGENSTATDGLTIDEPLSSHHGDENDLASIAQGSNSPLFCTDSVSLRFKTDQFSRSSILQKGYLPCSWLPSVDSEDQNRIDSRAERVEYAHSLPVSGSLWEENLLHCAAHPDVGDQEGNVTCHVSTYVQKLHFNRVIERIEAELSRG